MRFLCETRYRMHVFKNAQNMRRMLRRIVRVVERESRAMLQESPTITPALYAGCCAFHMQGVACMCVYTGSRTIGCSCMHCTEGCALHAARLDVGLSYRLAVGRKTWDDRSICRAAGCSLTSA